MAFAQGEPVTQAIRDHQAVERQLELPVATIRLAG